MSSPDRVAPAETVDAAEQETTDLLADVERLIAVLTTHGDPAVRETTTALLDRIDLVHRAALTRLMATIQSMAGDAFINRLTGDPVIRLLLMSYDLLAVDRRTLAEEALDAVRGHLRTHGIEVELTDVLGGVVTVRLHGAAADDPAYAGALHDVDEALRSGFLGFQELEVQDGNTSHTQLKDSAFLPRNALRRAQKPVYQALCNDDELADGQTRSILIGDTNVLVVRVGDEFFALRNACGDTPLPLDFSTLVGTELTCSWHGCRYDVRTGHRLDRADLGPEANLRVLPIRVRDGVVEIVVTTSAAA